MSTSLVLVNYRGWVDDVFKENLRLFMSPNCNSGYVTDRNCTSHLRLSGLYMGQRITRMFKRSD